MSQVDWKKHERNLAELLKDLGEDPTRDGLLKTPDRHLKSFQYLTSGYQKDVKEILTKALFDVEYKDMIIVRDVEFYSLCEHHLLPFHGRVHVGYIPNRKVVGLSKIPRLIDAFARRLQVQERLTHQIAKTIQDILEPEGVGVVVEAAHLCMMMRGVEKQASYTTTSSMQGSFHQTQTREEFLKLVHSPRKFT